MKKEILFGIVTYKEKFYECNSFLSLIESFESVEDAELTILVIDNTDVVNWSIDQNFVRKNIKIVYIHFPTNPGISFAYNKINAYADQNGFKWVIYLDQDTVLPLKSYLAYLNESNATSDPIKLPKVWANDKLLSPCWYMFHRSFWIKEITEKNLSAKRISCINSGIMINVNFFIEAGGYNERLRIDLCDHEFISRAKKRIQNFYILDIDLVQDFSAHTNNLQQDLSRYKHFVRDIRAYSVNRSKLTIFFSLDLAHCLKLTYKHRSFEFIKQRFFIKIS
ncbi:glycosyltransferase [Pedobacter nototheniae]|uniref:glycosyltransferase n=1 Tax=Pedobacter nototheniae TaxID=2488994 RepID=UPI00103BB8DE|nr:glycosyltransferase [Pedobacter nototheniae]